MKTLKSAIKYFLLLSVISSALPVFGLSQQAISYLNQGNTNYNKKKYTFAIQNYKKAIALDSKFKEAYNNLAIVYELTHQDLLAIECYKKIIKLNPSDKKSLNNLLISYTNLSLLYTQKGKFHEAVKVAQNALNYDSKYVKAYSAKGYAYEKMGKPDLSTAEYLKANKLAPNNIDILLNTASEYSKMQNFDTSLEYYEKVLALQPNNEIAKNNKKYVIQEGHKKDFSEKLNVLTPAQHAPVSLYKLISLSAGINPSAYAKACFMLDLLWAEPDARKLIRVLIDNKIPILITPGESETNSQTSVCTRQRTVSIGGVYNYVYDQENIKNTKVRLGEDHINAFRDPLVDADLRIYALHVFIHEFCHAVNDIISEKPSNSIEEEISGSMIGYNSVYKILLGRELSEDETKIYSKKCMKGILLDNHRFLPVFNGFNDRIKQFGIYPPYLYLWANIPELYKSIRNEPNINKDGSLENMIIGR